MLRERSPVINFMTLEFFHSQVSAETCSFAGFVIHNAPPSQNSVPFIIMLLHFTQVDNEVRLEDDWVPMDEQLAPGELEEVIREKEAHSRAVVLESVSI